MNVDKYCILTIRYSVFHICYFLFVIFFNLFEIKIEMKWNENIVASSQCRVSTLNWFCGGILTLKSLLLLIRWGKLDIKKYQAVSRMQSKVETNLLPPSGQYLREATNLISYFPPLWQDTNSDIKQCPLGLSNAGERIIKEKQHHTG